MRKTSEWAEWKRQFFASGKCIVAEREYSHKVACGEKATHRTKDGLPACEKHQQDNARDSWKGFIEGA